MAAGPMREERKVVTALFADIVGSTAMAERLDPEDVREVIGGALRFVIEIAEDFGGTVKDLAGDGALVLFGAPVAHEDDAERAVRAGLEIVRAIRAYGKEVRHGTTKEEVSIRVGVETGLAVLGPVGAGGRIEYGATGDAINTASRLQSHAEPGTVMVGEATYRRVAPVFVWGAPSTLVLKGKARAVTARPAISVRRRPGRGRGIEGMEASLVGRERELEVLREAAAALEHGRGATLFVVGDAGVGKTRLLRELRALLPDRALWLEGRCASYTERIPHWPLRELLSDALNLGSVADLPQRVRERFGERSEALLPFLSVIVGTADADPAERIAALSPVSLLRGMADAVGQVLVSLHEIRPVAIVVEDLHWADHSSLELLDRLIPAASAAGMLVVATSRVQADHASGSVLARSIAVPGVRRLDLATLPAGVDRGLLEALVGADVIPQAIEDRLLAAAEGNPFYLEELLRSLRDSGALRLVDGAWRLDEQVTVEIPETVEQVIVARLDRLTVRDRAVVDAACVIGRRFDLPLLAEVSGGSAPALGNVVGGLQRLDVIRGEPAPSTEYEFTHGLIQEAAYRTLVRPRRMELHRRAARALESRTSEREGLSGLVARHYRAAGEARPAFEWLVAAARQAGRAHAIAESLRAYDEAVEVAPEADIQPASALLAQIRLERGILRAQSGDLQGARAEFEVVLEAMSSGVDRSLEGRALAELGFLLAGAADYRASVPHLESAMRIAQERGDVPASVTALSRLSIVHTNLLRFDQARELGERALALAREAGDERLLARALDALKQVELEVGDRAAMDPIAEEVEEMLRRLDDRWLLQFVVFERGYLAMGIGRWDEAWSRMSEAREINQRIGDRGNEPLIEATIGRLFRFQGRYREALDLGRRATAHARAVGHAEWTAWSELFLGTTLLDLSALEEAEPHLRSATEAAEAGGARLHLVRAEGLLARCRWMLGDLRQAREVLARAHRMLEQVVCPPGSSYLPGTDAYLAVADVLLAEGDLDRAMALVEPVAVAGQRFGWVEAEVGGAIVLGRCLEARGELEEAAAQYGHAAHRAALIGVPILELEARLALTSVLRGRGAPDAESEAEVARGLIERLSTQIGDERLRDGFARAASATLAGRGGGAR